jgi:RNA-binding protein
MANLASSQRKWLRGQAHELRPVVQIGKQGLTEGVLRQVDEELSNHELIKVQLPAQREQKDEIAARLATELGAEIAGRIGHIIILYRQQPDPEKRSIEFP